jgi:hypothetical protein
MRHWGATSSAKSAAMSGKSYEEVRRLARIWFTEAREKSAQDDAEIAAWRKEHRKRNADAGEGGDERIFDSEGGGGSEGH